MKKIIKTTIFLLLLVLLFAVPVLAKTHYGSFNTKHGAVNCRLGASYPGGKRGNAHATTYWQMTHQKAPKLQGLILEFILKMIQNPHMKGKIPTQLNQVRNNHM